MAINIRHKAPKIEIFIEFTALILLSHLKRIVIKSDCMPEHVEEHNICELGELTSIIDNDSFCDLF